MSLTALLGIDLPILQAPMAGAQGSAMAIAVSNAGGLGALPAAMLDAATLAKELTAIRAGTTRPYNVNFFCHQPPPANQAADAAWAKLLTPYYAELGLDPASIAPGPGRAPFSPALADVLDDFRPPLVSFHFGLPVPELLARVRGWGSKVIASATTVAEARWLAERGVDAVIAQGAEAGGHRGCFLDPDPLHAVAEQLGTFALLPQVVAAVDVPVIAAGGIADAQGVRAALALGAAAVQVGTAYLLCPEATISPLHRTALRSADAERTALTNLFSGRPARGIVNRLMAELGPLNAQAPAFPLATAAIAPLRAAAEALGRTDFTPLWSGQHVGNREGLSAAELTRRLAGRDD
ncbi:nitronate monooxygenase [Denitratisoma sp. agr-D3]